MKMRCLLVTLIIVLSCSSSSFVYSHIHPRLNNATDQHSLLQFKAAITHDPRHSLADWNPNISFCGWTGVTCSSRRQRVVALNLSNIGLEGSISSSLGNLSFLHLLALDNNKLQANIPPQLGRLRRLRKLILHRNGLEGNIPTSLCGCRNLVELSLSYNFLSGSIPAEVSLVARLKILHLETNNLTGSIPFELGRLTQLEELYLGDNILTGPISYSLGNLSSLERISLDQNQLSGTLPPLSIGLLSPKLSILSLSNNNIEGSIPEQIGNLTNLTYLGLGKNAFGGGIPRTFARLKRLERLHLEDNHLEGTIPNEIGQMEGLGLLSISHNLFSGEVPGFLSQLQQLRRLHLDHNKFSGKIPAALGECQILELLDLSHNRLSGSIPPEIGDLKNLLFYMNLSCNCLRGSLPPEIGKITMALAIDISENRLAGFIPSGLGSCIALEYLNASHNTFRGPIPSALGKLQNLQIMDLSWNLLSGTVPNFLQNLKMLFRADFSFNYLTGEIPEGGVFSNHNITILLEGNSGLCGPTRYSLPPCPNPKQGHFSLSKKARVAIVFISAFTLWCLLGAGFLWRWYSYEKGLDISKNGASKLEMLSYQDLATATHGFDEANLVGAGSFGSVYKGVLMDGTVVAIKVLDLQHEEVSKSFDIECEILLRVQHRNLVKIIASCSNLHFKGLVLQFVSNGSLENHLHSDRDENYSQNVCQLRLSKRLDIAIDIAYGLAYLHHDCFVQVVHRDLKPSNVLLDGKMKALVTDFGLAKLIDANCIQPFTSPAVGSIGYIAPEYGLGGRVSTKGDVYSFGILSLEMMTRKRPTDDMFVDGLTLQKWVSRAFPNGLIEVVDGSLLTSPNNDGLNQSHISDYLTQLIHVALLCTKESPRERPTMIDVVRKLEKIRDRYGGIIMDSLPPLERLTLQLRPEVVSFESDSSSPMPSF